MTPTIAVGSGREEAAGPTSTTQLRTILSNQMENADHYGDARLIEAWQAKAGAR